jgi:hypothetical protein
MEFEDEYVDVIEEEEPAEDDVKLAEVYRLAIRLIRLLDSVKSQELKEGASLMLIREILGDDPVLMGLASKMIQDLSYGLVEDENYVS